MPRWKQQFIELQEKISLKPRVFSAKFVCDLTFVLLFSLATCFVGDSLAEQMTTDVVIVGGGLSGSLVAYALAKRQPQTKTLLIEASPSFTTAKTWSFHESDLGGLKTEFHPLMSHRWSGYDIHFPNYSRKVDLPYCAFRPEHFYQKLITTPGIKVLMGSAARTLSNSRVEFSDGGITSQVVIDARNKKFNGPEAYQKFFGLQVKLKKPHGLARPILMDVRIPQYDGYRFMYVLPWSEDELLVEETFYSDIPDLDLQKSKGEVLKYISSQGWELETILDEEDGCLSIPLVKPQYSLEDSEVVQIGMQAGFFHPVTGYSVPYAARVADAISQIDKISASKVLELLEAIKSKEDKKKPYLYLLNRLLFEAAPPEKRFKIFEHFYKLSDPLIARFYRGELTMFDQVRILTGKPPVPVSSALKTIFTPMRHHAR